MRKGQKRLKKSIFILVTILLIAVVISATFISINNKQRFMNRQQNKEYEKYLNKEIYGTDVITIINRATDSNQKNNVATNEKGNYISDGQNSILIDIVLITNEDKGETKSYKMENISKVGISKFITNFNTAKFRITKMDYHKETGKISNIEMTQQRE